MKERRRRMDCREAFEHLYAYLDRELTEEHTARVRAHLEDCKDRLALARFETAYLRFLEARIVSRRAPEQLKKRILRELLFDRTDAEAE